MPCDLCQIVSGARPVPRVHESETTIAFVDRAPFSGLILVVPRLHVPRLQQLPDLSMGAFLASLIEVMERVTETLRPERLVVSWTQAGAETAGQGHVLVRLVPVFADDASRARAVGDGASDQHLASLAAKIRPVAVDSRRGSPSRLVPRRMAALAGDPGGDP